MKPQVYSARAGASQAPLDEPAAYVGRPSKFGNPFKVGRDGTRQECVDKYEEWIMQPGQTALRNRMRVELRGKNLVCWCAPQPCHADVILRIANA